MTQMSFRDPEFIFGKFLNKDLASDVKIGSKA